MGDWEDVIRVVAAVAGAYWAILWLSAIVWTYRDVKDRSSDSTSQVVAVFLVLVFNIPGLFLYLILRPPLTMAEAYERNLETEAILHEVGEVRACPSCKGPGGARVLLLPSLRGGVARTLPRLWQAAEPELAGLSLLREEAGSPHRAEPVPRAGEQPRDDPNVLRHSTSLTAPRFLAPR